MRSFWGWVPIGVALLVAAPALAETANRHVLAEAIWSNGAKALVDRPALITALRAADIALIGEVHDNAEAHQMQADAASAVTFAGRRPGAVFEHIRDDQQPALDEFRRFDADTPRPATGADLLRFLDWDKSGWPDRKIFETLFSTVIGAKLPIYAGDPARESIKRIAKEGESALPEEERTRLGLDRPLPEAAQEGLLTELEQSHCGLMSKTAFGNLAFAQRYRDAHLADAALKAASENGSAILFAGNGHVRKDRGVPYYLRQRAPEMKIVAVMLIEIEDGKPDPEAYVERDPDGQATADFMVFTSRAVRADPCEEMRKHFAKPAAK